ncbi:cyclin-dependent kinase inhibitor 5-like [Magnolia sinica]|uniref:cyclin-dependent kinase inhibitor 5-like n=1 Tax=Magnolia sinica TaxID=86752 RepID=UPI0026599C95|nr:cyclin-dependent kinase inhibitor 5-like [Magnolia sinica]
MGKYMRKAKITGEVAVMELSQASLGVRTRAKTLALQRLQKTTTSSSYLQLRSRRLEKPPLVAASESKKTKEICKENPSTVHRLLSDSTNSGSVGSVSLGCLKKNEEAAAAAAAAETDGPPENIEVGIEASFGENILEIDGRERNIRETTPSSLIRDSENLGTPGSTTRPTNSTATNRRIQIHRNIPTTHEMEEFFAGAEQQQQRIFTEKYNYDPVNDLPLPGRYEWVTLDQ